MIQRIQSVLLFLVGCLMISFIFLKLWEKTSIDFTQRATLTAISLTHGQVGAEGEIATIVNQKSTIYLAIIAGLAAAVAFYSIFRYDNRLLQMKLGALNSLLIAASVGITFLLTKTGEGYFDDNMVGRLQAGVYLAMLALLFNIIANRFIRKDEQLVRSVDRIR
jgi:hypothetical protein